MGGRAAPTGPGAPGGVGGGGGFGGPGGPGPLPAPRSLRERFSALRNLPPFLKLIWQTSRPLTAVDLVLRLVRALLPVATLYVGKLIVDEVVALATAPGGPTSLSGWWDSGRLDHLGWLLGAELGLAVLSDLLGRVVSLADTLLA